MYIDVKVVYLNYDLIIVFKNYLKYILNSYYITLLCRFIVFILFPYKEIFSWIGLKLSHTGLGFIVEP